MPPHVSSFVRAKHRSITKVQRIHWILNREQSQSICGNFPERQKVGCVERTHSEEKDFRGVSNAG